MIVDAHIHVWSPDRDRYPYAPGFSPADPWLPSFTPDDHQRWSAAVGEPMRINLIQITWYGLDHSYIIDLIDSDPERYVGTGIIPAVTDAGLGSPDRTMLDLAARGVRAFRIRGRSAQPAFGQRERWLDQEGYERVFATASEHGLVLSFLIGPADLAASMGHLGDIFHPDVQAQIADIIESAKKIGVPGGFAATPVETNKLRIEQGFQWITIGIDMVLFRQAAETALAELKE